MAKENRILFVEGGDDEHTIYALCEHFQVEETFVVEVPDSKGKINKSARANEKGGIDNVLKAMQGFLFAGNVERLGIVIDADQNLNNQWERVANILKKAGYSEIEPQPNPNGTIIKQAEKMTFGVWIMPDNQTERAYLETFLKFLVPEGNETWKQAKKCVADLKEKPFVKMNADHTDKAEIHTFLAWQQEPGKPFGTAITAKYLQADNPQCQSFVDWLNRLFVN